MTDNYYYSVNWQTLLGNTNTYSTLWLNRKEVPKDLQKKRLKEEIVACQEGGVFVMHCNDQKK
jgi:hypothetical protein